MALNYIWISFFLIAFIVGLVKLIFFNDMEVFGSMMNATFEMSRTGFEISLYLTGVISLWLGIMRIGQSGGVINAMNRLVAPFFSRLFPEIPREHPVYGTMLMNISANMLGLDNAATPMGLKAMNQLQELNTKEDTASNAQIMFLVLNTSALTILPVSIMLYRYEMGAESPADVFIPILLATFFSTLAGLIAVSIVQKINLFQKSILIYLVIITSSIALIIWYFTSLPTEKLGPQSSLISNIILFGIIILFILMALRKKVNIYDEFIEGAKEGFGYAIKIIPYLIAILVAIGVFRASGSLEIITDGFRYFFGIFGINTDFVDALPTAFMKPLSGSGARGMMIETMDKFGADSFAGRLSSVMQGSTETTFYIIAVYFGSVGIRNTRHAVSCGLIADFAGIIASIIISYIFFH